MSDQTKGLAALLAAHGRNGDTELVHATKGEVAALNRVKRGIDGKDLPRNPHTGLREANFFNQYVVPILPAAAGLAAGALTGGTMAVPAAALAGGVTGAGAKAIQGGSTQDVLIGGGLGAISGAGAGSLGAGLGVGAAGTGAAEAGAGAATGVGEAGAIGAESAAAGAPNAFVGTPAALPGSETAFGTAGGASVTPGATTPFQQGLAEGMNAYSGTAPTEYAMFGEGSAAAGKTMAGAPASAATAPEVAARPAVSSVEYAPFGGDTAPAKTGINWDYLGTDKAAADASKLGIGTLGAMSMYQGDLSGTTTEEVDKTLPKSEVYYTPTGERRTRIVDRPQYGNVNMARGGDVYGDYDGADEAPDGGYHPGGGLNYAGGGIAGTGWGEQNRGGFSGFTESLQPGGALGEWHGKLYGALGADQVMPGGAMGSLIPGANQYNAQKRKEEERKRAEEEAGIAAAAKAKQEADFKQKWDERYSQGMATGGISSLGHYSDGGQLLRGPGDGVSDSIPASIEGKRPARLADGEFVIPARAVSELGNGSTEAGSKQLYAMLDRIAKKRKTGKGLAYQSSPKKILPV